MVGGGVVGWDRRRRRQDPTRCTRRRPAVVVSDGRRGRRSGRRGRRRRGGRRTTSVCRARPPARRGRPVAARRAAAAAASCSSTFTSAHATADQFLLALIVVDALHGGASASAACPAPAPTDPGRSAAAPRRAAARQAPLVVAGGRLLTEDHRAHAVERVAGPCARTTAAPKPPRHSTAAAVDPTRASDLRERCTRALSRESNAISASRGVTGTVSGASRMSSRQPDEQE